MPERGHHRQEHNKKNRRRKIVEPQAFPIQTTEINPNLGNYLNEERVHRRKRAMEHLVGFPSLLFATISMRYDIHHIELLSSYGKDFAGPLVSWMGARMLSQLVHSPLLEKLADSKIPLALYSAYAVGYELLQSQGVRLNYDGRFDPMDLVAMGAGTAFALAVDKYIFPKGGENRVKS